MHLTINLAKGSGKRELIEVLQAAQAVKPARQNHLNPLNLLTKGVQSGLTLVLNGLHKVIHRQVCRWVTCKRGAQYYSTCRKRQQELNAWLRLTFGRLAVKL
ncbi:MAG: hypothetical protein BroJett011_77080 [Chloroflexota bacterium]|nr:MAG: hypothetical protein BroJett011_77080 [Chloroflexota bacterium]